MTSVPFDPYHKWLGIPRAEQPAHHYRLLGIPLFEDDTQVIEAAADRHMAFLRKYQSGEHSADATRVLNEVSRARLCLLKPATKLAYDEELRQSLAASDKNSESRPLWRQPVALLTATVAGAALVIVLVVLNTGGAPQAAKVPPPADGKRVDDKPETDQIAPPVAKSEPTQANESHKSGSTAKVSKTPAVVAKKDKAPWPTLTDDDSDSEVKPQKNTAPLKSNHVALNSNKAVERKPPEPAPPAPVSPPSSPRGQRPPDESPSADEVPVAKLPTPDDDAQRTALKQVRDTFAVQYSNARKAEGRNLEPRIALARTLFATAKGETNDPAVCFVMLSEAAEFASEAGQLELSWEILEALGEQFDLTPLPLMQKAAKAAKPFAKSAEETALLASLYVRLINAAIQADDFETASKAGQEANAATRKIPVLKDQLVAYTRRVSQLREAYELAKAARLQLQTKPDDASANLTWGRYLCFHKKDWTAGLPCLAKSGDARLAPLAQRDIDRSATNVDELTRLGDDWWEVAGTEKDPQQDIIRDRAVDAWQSALLMAEDNQQPALIDKIGRAFENTKTFVTSGTGQGIAVADANMEPGIFFTFEFWVATKALNGILISKRQQVSDTSIVLTLRNGRVVVGGDSSGGFVRSEAREPINDGLWHHVAVVKVHKRLGLFIDGKWVARRDVTESYSSKSVWKAGYQDTADFAELPARFCRIRLSKEARYLVNFIPEKTYFSDKNTLFVPR